MRPDADAVERYVRRERLRRRAAARAPASLDADGLLHRGALWVALPPGELAALAALLSEPGYHGRPGRPARRSSRRAT